MIIYPAIDLKDGQCVRLLRGDMKCATVFNQSPVAQALSFQGEGAKFLHIVDLNGAFKGQSVNGDAVNDILENVNIPIQLGGGIRSLDDIDYWVNKGVARVILGTVAIKDPDLVITAATRHPGKIAIGLDTKDGMVACNGWEDDTTIKAEDLAIKFADAGIVAIIHTDINRDGAMMGVNFAETASLARKVSIPIIASGGAKNIDDVKTALSTRGIAGLISGRALYDGSLDLKEALQLCDDAEKGGK